MKSTLLSAGTLLLVCALSPRLAGVLFASDNIATPSAGQQFFKDKVRPILTEKCYQCHTDSPLSHLRADSRAALLEGGRGGPPMVPGDPEGSQPIEAVRQHGDRQRPQNCK